MRHCAWGYILKEWTEEWTISSVTMCMKNHTADSCEVTTNWYQLSSVFNKITNGKSCPYSKCLRVGFIPLAKRWFSSLWSRVPPCLASLEKAVV